MATLKWERALAYAGAQKLKRALPKPVMPMFMDCEVEKVHWGWSSMKRTW